MAIIGLRYDLYIAGEWKVIERDINESEAVNLSQFKALQGIE